VKVDSRYDQFPETSLLKDYSPDYRRVFIPACALFFMSRQILETTKKENPMIIHIFS
jgi:hypothetical protein